MTENDKKQVIFVVAVVLVGSLVIISIPALLAYFF